jgi:glycosyltransferase involved in cell wall biosynthesis
MGGIQTVTRQLADGLIEKGHEVLVIANRYPTNLSKSDTSQKYRIIRFIHWGNQKINLKEPKSILLNVLGFLLFKRQLTKVESILRQYNPDVINIHFPHHQNKFAVKLIDRFPGIRLVTSLHGNEILKWYEKENGFVSNQISINARSSKQFIDQTTLLKASATVTTCSNWLKEKTIGICPEIEQDTQVIWNAVNLNVFDRVEPMTYDSAYFFSFGRLEPAKGFDILIHAYAGLIKDRKEDLPCLIIAGTGIEEQALKKLSEELGLQRKIIFTGRLSQIEIAAYCKGAVCNVVASRIEPFGISVLEALASERPFIGFNTGGIPEICSNTVTLINPDVTTLKVALISVVYENGFKLPTEQVKSLLANFTVEKMINSYLDVFSIRKI